jgi:two-component system response regulator YesN
MLKLLIVDDEPFTREGLRYHFDWSRYGIEVAGEVDDGIKALELIEELGPDIVLTDVRMPDMDGLEMARRIKASHENIKIIVMSAYDDIGYVKSALKVNALDYILKPVDLKELDAVIQKVAHIINGEYEEQQLIRRMSAKLMQSMPMLREKFLMTLVRDGLEGKADIASRTGFLELNLPVDADYCVLEINVDDRASTLESLSERDRQLTSFAVINICDELMNRLFNGYSFENRPGEYVCLLNCSLNEEGNNCVHEIGEQLYSLISEIREKLSECLKLSVTIGVGPVVHGVDNVAKSHAKAAANVCQRLFLGKNKIIMIDSLDTGDDVIDRFDFARSDRVVNLLKGSDEARLVEAIDDFFKELAPCKYINARHCMNICFQLILTASRQLMELAIDPVGMRSESEVCDALSRLETLGEMQSFATEYLVALHRIIDEKRSRKSSNIIDRIKQVIQKRYSENLSIRDIAGEVYLSTTYLCMIYKQETGETVNGYITRVRIEHAKELLRDPAIRLYDICHEIGYTEPGYFSKIFKKYTDLSPTEYRQSVV